MSETSTVTLLYTAGLVGNLALLPQLSTIIQQERRTATGPVLLLDLGDTCALDAWICQVTQGRAPFIVLDGMGYDVALIGGPEQAPIPIASLRQLLDTIAMQIMVWNRSAQMTKRGITFTIAPGITPDVSESEAEPSIYVDRSTDALPEVDAPYVVLGDVAPGVLARVDMNWPNWTVQAARVVTVAHDTPSDPTIAAVVEFVENEARNFAQQQRNAL